MMLRSSVVQGTNRCDTQHPHVRALAAKSNSKLCASSSMESQSKADHIQQKVHESETHKGY